ncbi:MAG: orotate phosphoribosyltransferase [Candidatus Thermoplasmatota archaeon]|nr:orotate phosphoribosyltransferase [Candidatus Thermoplasmatota archaeon]
MVGRETVLKQLLKDMKVVQTGEFILASGKKSNYFVNIKRASTNPQVLREIGKAMAPYVGEAKIAGMALGAVPLAVAVALETNRPFVIVRKEPKDHGAKDLIEGEVLPGEKFVIVEDVATTGGSTLRVVSALREKGANVAKAIVVVDRLEGAREMLTEHGIELISLFTVKDLA